MVVCGGTFFNGSLSGWGEDSLDTDKSFAASPSPRTTPAGPRPQKASRLWLFRLSHVPLPLYCGTHVGASASTATVSWLIMPITLRQSSATTSNMVSLPLVSMNSES